MVCSHKLSLVAAPLLKIIITHTKQTQHMIQQQRREDPRFKHPQLPPNHFAREKKTKKRNSRCLASRQRAHARPRGEGDSCSLLVTFALRKSTYGCGMVWVKIKPPKDHRFWSMLPLTRVPFWVPIVDPQPYGSVFSLGNPQNAGFPVVSPCFHLTSRCLNSVMDGLCCPLKPPNKQVLKYRGWTTFHRTCQLGLMTPYMILVDKSQFPAGAGCCPSTWTGFALPWENEA